jgi:cell division transport system permease protein
MAQLKQNMAMRRQWLTFLRMIRYGINNFSRNAWLTIAATAVMTITLTVVLTTLVARNVFADTLAQIREKVDISIYLSNETTPSTAAQLQKKIEQDPNVTHVRYVSLDQARRDYLAQIKTDTEQLQLLSEVGSDISLPQSLRVMVKDPGELDRLKNLVSTDEDFKKSINPTTPPSYAVNNSSSIDQIARIASFTEQVGLIASFVFVVISTLIIFNTVRMAIFNRKEEIQMMKLIGADRSFIRGPFIVEAVMYGFIAAIIATGLIYLLLITTQDQLATYGVSVTNTFEMMQTYPALVLLGTIVLGAALGIISSQLAVRRYLRV